MKTTFMAALVAASIATAAISETNLGILSFPGNGELTWSNCPGAVQYKVEWASSLNGGWTNSWESLNAILATGSTYTVRVPVFYRLVATFPDYARLLLHCDGPGGATNFPDAAGGHAVSAVGSARVSAAQAKFGNAAYFDGDSAYLEAADSPDFEPGSQPFTIDFWMYPLDGAGWSFPLSKSVPDAGLGYDIRFAGNSIRVVGVNGWAENIISGACISTGDWNHVAISSTSNTVYLFVNGVQQGTCPRSNIPDTGVPLRIGWAGSNYGAALYHGYVDEVRITLGMARWTNNFAVPTSPYTDD